MTNREWLETLNNHEFSEKVFKPNAICNGCPSRRKSSSIIVNCGLECEKGMERWLRKEHKDDTD